MNNILSKFSHELRNPLTSLSSSVQFIEYQHPEVKEYKFWGNLSSDIDYMLRLLEQFSDLSKANELQMAPCSLETLLSKVSLSFAAMVADTGVQFTSKIDPALPQIMGDGTKLQEVFRNLLKNALDATLPDKTITLEAVRVSDGAEIRICDTGCGIPKERLATIFDAFVTYKPEGTGLGLAICRQIVEAHGGTISVESDPNVGTTFTVRLL